MALTRAGRWQNPLWLPPKVYKVVAVAFDSMAGVSWSIDSVAYFAAGNVLSYRSIHRRPIKVSRCEFSSSKSSQVTGFGVIVEMTYQLAAQRIICRHVYPPLVGQGSWDDLPLTIPCVRRSILSTALRQIGDPDHWRIDYLLVYVDGKWVGSLGGPDCR